MRILLLLSLFALAFSACTVDGRCTTTTDCDTATLATTCQKSDGTRHTTLDAAAAQTVCKDSLTAKCVALAAATACQDAGVPGGTASDCYFFAEDTAKETLIQACYHGSANFQGKDAADGVQGTATNIGQCVALMTGTHIRYGITSATDFTCKSLPLSSSANCADRKTYIVEATSATLIMDSASYCTSKWCTNANLTIDSSLVTIYSTDETIGILVADVPASYLQGGSGTLSNKMYCRTDAATPACVSMIGPAVAGTLDWTFTYGSTNELDSLITHCVVDGLCVANTAPNCCEFVDVTHLPKLKTLSSTTPLESSNANVVIRLKKGICKSVTLSGGSCRDPATGAEMTFGDNPLLCWTAGTGECADATAAGKARLSNEQCVDENSTVTGYSANVTVWTNCFIWDPTKSVCTTCSSYFQNCGSFAM